MGSVNKAIVQLSQTLELDPNDTLESVEQEFFSHSLIPAAEWPALIEILDSGSASDQKHVATLEAASIAAGRERIDNYLKVLCTTELAPRKNIVTKKLADKHPDWLARRHALDNESRQAIDTIKGVISAVVMTASS